MVNLRYHVVTLVAVFLALAVGVVLGAGPLQSRINAAAEGSNLAERSAQLEDQVAQLQGTSAQQDAFISGVSKDLLPQTLADRTVAVVTLPGTSDTDVKGVEDALALAGAKVSGTVQLTENWSSTGQREYRDTLSAPVSSHLPGGGGGAATADDVLGQALVQVLTTSGAEIDLVREILSDPQVPLVAADSLPSEPVDSIVLVGPQTASASAGNDSQSGTGIANDQSLVALAKAIATAPKGGVAVGSAANPSDLISILRTAAAPISTVDQGGTAMAAFNVALALHSTEVGAYGQQEGASAAVAPLN